MAESMNDGHPYFGIDNFIAQDRRYDGAFARNQLKALDIKVHSIDKQPTSPTHVVVSGWCNYSWTVIPNTFEVVFPHVKKNYAIVQKLLGQVVTGVSRYDFVFDTATNRIIETRLDLNFAPVFMMLLGNPTEVAILFGDVQITVDYVISADDEPATPKISEAMPSSHVNRMGIDDLLS